MIITEHLRQSNEQTIFLSLVKPWVLKVNSENCQLREDVSRLIQKNGGRFFSLDWEKMQNPSDFYDELIDKLKLPSYFGRNLNALSDCLADVDVMGEGPFILWIDGVKDIRRMSDEEQSIAGLVDTLEALGQEWSLPANCGEPWERPAQPFHTVFVITSPLNVPEFLNRLPEVPVPSKRPIPIRDDDAP